jgi:hypothetical protein
VDLPKKFDTPGCWREAYPMPPMAFALDPVWGDAEHFIAMRDLGARPGSHRHR